MKSLGKILSSTVQYARHKKLKYFVCLSSYIVEDNERNERKENVKKKASVHVGSTANISVRLMI